MLQIYIIVLFGISLKSLHYAHFILIIVVTFPVVIAHVTIQIVQVGTHLIHRALNSFVKANSKLGNLNLHCKYLQCVVVY